jgi:hypothetical protein
MVTLSQQQRFRSNDSSFRMSTAASRCAHGFAEAPASPEGLLHT